MREVVIIGAVRTAIGNYGGTLKSIPAYDLGAEVLNNVMKSLGLNPEQVDQVILGQNYQSGEYVNIARMSLLKAGWPAKIPGFTFDRRCCSGLDAIGFAAKNIETGSVDLVAAGGVESMSTAELYIPGEYIKWGLGGREDMPRGHGHLSLWGIPFYDRIQRARVMSQPKERYGVLPTMMTWADSAAKEYNISRQEVDDWAFIAHQRALSAIKLGLFKEEIIPIIVPSKRGEEILFERDERPRADTTKEALAKLRPVLGGVCTAGNSSSESDGAAVCLVASKEKAEEIGIAPMAYIRSYVPTGVEPGSTWKAVSIAVKKALKEVGLSLSDINLIEIHEAFAAQVLANFRDLGLKEKDYDRINVNGSCISLGHPLGCTGARIMTTLLHEMIRRNARYGLEAICGGGGMGVCMIVERRAN